MTTPTKQYITHTHTHVHYLRSKILILYEVRMSSVLIRWYDTVGAKWVWSDTNWSGCGLPAVGAHFEIEVRLGSKGHPPSKLCVT